MLFRGKLSLQTAKNDIKNLQQMVYDLYRKRPFLR
jgi:hypothetical protein